jgi:septal ring factor EnvC (AmiA/AmiB activator)
MPFLRRSSNDRPAADELRCRATRSCKVLVALGMASLLLGALSPANAAKITERARQKRAVESERIELRQKLADLKRDIDRTETEKGRAADALAHSEAAISEANRLLRELANDQAQTEAKLNQLSKQQTQLANAVDIQQKQLARLLREQYVAGNEDRVKLLLSGDNPNRINRDLQYMGYVSQAQARLLTSLRANLQAVEANRAEMQNAKDELEEIAQEARQQKARLEKEKSGRAALLAQLSAKLASQRKEAGHIERNEQRLAGLVARLSKLIDEQRKAEAAAQAKRRQAQLARAKQERQRAAQARNGAAGKAPRAIEDEPPTKTVARNELAPEAHVQEGQFSRPFASLRGQLRLPVKGELLARFGGKRGDGPPWKGLFIRAPEGTEIRAVAAGKIIFADWLRGFGNLVIVDHGSQYMTIYGNVQSALKQVGDIVQGGDAIAAAGSSGGSEQSGLYFEMRHQGRAFDPLGWITIR